jgi:mono/diheme cytochrome c family protein
MATSETQHSRARPPATDKEIRENSMSNSTDKNAVSLATMVLTLALGLASANVPGAEDPDRGRALHETHCRMCHESVAYKRDKKVAKTYEEVRAQVVRWQTYSGLNWSNEDIDSVALYLASTYYKIP